MLFTTYTHAHYQHTRVPMLTFIKLDQSSYYLIISHILRLHCCLIGKQNIALIVSHVEKA